MALVALPLSTYVTMVGGHQIARHNLPLVKLCWQSWIISLSSVCLNIASTKNCFMIFLSTEVRLTVPFLKTEVVFPILLSLGTSPNCHDVKYDGEWLLATTSSSSLWCIWSGCRDIRVVKVHQVISNPVFKYSGRNLLSQSLPWSSEVWEKKKGEILVQLLKFLSLFSVLLPDRSSRVGP